ncbi:MAG: trehalase family glycosidase [Acidobacteriaceae bacterium]
MSSDPINRREFSLLLAASAASFRNDWLRAGNPSADEAATEENAIAGHAFPASDYTPFGYLDNPGHSAVLHRSGAVRSVPPLGFGWWAREMPWPYGEGTLCPVNYLSFLHLSFVLDGKTQFHQREDFAAHDVAIVSRYHTKNLFSYDWSFEDVRVSIQYVLASPDVLLARIEMRNSGAASHNLTLHATNVYGYPQQPWWGSDGITSMLDPDHAALSKIWAYGDIFALAGDRPSQAGKGTADSKEWEQWIAGNDLSRNAGTSARFPGAMHTMQSYAIAPRPGQSDTVTLSLVRGVNQEAALSRSRSSLAEVAASMRIKLEDDDRFYRTAPLLTGDWPSQWKHGWIYDFETLRMTMRPAVGIYKHRWDGMQIFTPRAVLGETMLDTMALSYADVELAKDVILGAFADAPAANIPCSREDGSVNMICADGSEAGTAPTWGMPFRVIRSIYIRNRDAAWIEDLYPHMRRFLNWWLANRTDSNGWFHCKCSWESGQDASKRFLVAAENPGAVSDFVRTVDVEAAMAEAFRNMALFCEVAGFPQEKARWSQLAQHRVETTRAMFVDGWFRDFDNRNNQPIILKDYFDIMMLYPLAAGIATDDQARALVPRLEYFADNPLYWLEWPSFLFPFSEASWNAGRREFIGKIVARTADRVYRRTDARATRTIAPFESTLPPEYQFRIPGIANEFWPIQDDNPGGCENYGWGATLPTLLIRNVIGFRELDDPAKNAFQLAPALPANLLQAGGVYGVRNMNFRSTSVEVEYHASGGSELRVRLRATGKARQIAVSDDSGKQLGAGPVIEFAGRNGRVYTVEIGS